MDRNNRRDRETGEAARWWSGIFLRSSRRPTPAEREEFARWLRESPTNVNELLHMAHVDDALKRFKRWHETRSAGEAESSQQAAQVVQLSEYRLPPESGLSRRREFRRKPVALAAAAAGVAIAALFLARGLLPETVSTAHGERRAVTLEDGSVVQLDPETTLRVRFGAHERNLTLERGRALFRVAKDAQRPFLVAANDTVVRAVGTVFGVEERDDADIVVTVVEGKVAVLSVPDLPISAKANRQKTGVYLSAGKQLTVAQSRIGSVRSVDAAAEVSWAEGRLVFNGTPLSEVLEQFNRYSHVRMSVHDPALARRPITGVFATSDPETLIAFIEAGADAVVKREQQDTIVFTPRGSDEMAN